MNAYPFSRILLVTEHTEFDAGAERVAFAMAQRCGVPLRVVLPVVSNPVYEVEAPELVQRDERAAAEKIAELRKRAAELNVEIDIHVRHGEEPYREIVAEAASAETDLIVIRRRGKPGFLANLLVGEMVSKVIRDAPCAVLMVPRKAEFWRRGVLAAVGDTPAAQGIATHAATIAATCDLPLTIVSVAERRETQAAAEQLNAQNVALATTLCSRVTGRVATGTPVEQTLAIAQETSADLIVIGRQRYHLIPFSRGNSSIMQKIAGALDVTTLVIPSQAE